MGKILIFILGGLFGSYNLLSFVFDSNHLEPYVEESRTASFHSSEFFYQMQDTVIADSAKSCTDCHDDHVTGEVVHAPAKKDCLRCHVANGEEHPLDNTAGFSLKKNIPELCYECHEEKTDKEFVHDPSKKGDCTVCHDIHSSDNLYLVKSDPIGPICYECHDLKIPKGNFVHGAVSDGDCAGCHDPHQADNKSFLANSKLDRLCKKCHKGVRKEFKKEHVHAPFKKKNCFDCHNAHSSKEAHLSDMKPKDLCLSCHEDVHKQLDGTKLIHGAINEPESCLNCHASHSSNQENILKYENVELCLRCHEESIQTKTGSLDAIGPHLAEGNFIHGAITEEGCSTCHKSHVSENGNLLTEAFPIGVYAKATEDNYQLCFRCHDKDLMFAETTSTATNFRDGESNLHFVHMNGDKARNCNACHDVHGSKNKYLIKQTTTFGSWDMPVKYSLNSDGGSCLTGCHKESKYVRIVQDSSNVIKLEEGQ